MTKDVKKFKRGDILKSKHPEAIHPIVFLEGKDENFFIGLMITSSSSAKYKDNISMSEIHFNKTDKLGKDFETYFKKSYFVGSRLLKKLNWKPFKKTGELSSAGVSFVIEKTKKSNPKIWEEYIKTAK